MDGDLVYLGICSREVLLMVRVHKMLTIEQDLMDKLKGVNASGLVNELLTAHFNKTDIKKMTGDELRHRIKVEKLKLKHKQEMETVENE
jgi:hypothetical protein